MGVKNQLTCDSLSAAALGQGLVLQEDVGGDRSREDLKKVRPKINSGMVLLPLGGKKPRN